MRATFNNPSLFQHHNCVGVTDGGKPVSNHEDGAPRHEGVHATFDEGLGARIDRACRLIENEDRRVGHGRSGNRQKLALASREVGAVCGHERVVALGQAVDEAVRVRGASSGFPASVPPQRRQS